MLGSLKQQPIIFPMHPLVAATSSSMWLEGASRISRILSNGERSVVAIMWPEIQAPMKWAHTKTFFCPSSFLVRKSKSVALFLWNKPPYILERNGGVMNQSCLVDVSDVSGVGKTSVVKGQHAAARLQQLLVQTHPEISHNWYVHDMMRVLWGWRSNSLVSTCVQSHASVWHHADKEQKASLGPDWQESCAKNPTQVSQAIHWSGFVRPKSWCFGAFVLASPCICLQDWDLGSEGHPCCPLLR